MISSIISLEIQNNSSKKYPFYCLNNVLSSYRSKKRTCGINFQDKRDGIHPSNHPFIHPDGRNFTIGEEKKRISLRRASISQMYRFISISYRVGRQYSRYEGDGVERDPWRVKCVGRRLGGGVPETAISRRLSSCKVSSSSVDTWRGSVPSSRPSRPTNRNYP